MSGEAVDDMTGRGRGGLTPADREFLLKTEDERREDYSRQARSDARVRIRERVRASLRDFQLLADELAEEERNKIFAATDDPRTDEYRELKTDVSAAIEFMYTGMDGESGFRQPLEWAVANGENTLGNVETSFDVAPRFAVDTVHPTDRRAVVDAVKDEQWSRVTTPPALLSFIKLALRSDAIDFEKIHDQLDREEDFVDADLGDYAPDPDGETDEEI